MQRRLLGICGPNGSGKSTAYEQFRRSGQLRDYRWVNADELLVELRSGTDVPLARFGLNETTAASFNALVEYHAITRLRQAKGQMISLYAFGAPAAIRIDAEATAYEAAIATAVIRDCLIAERRSFAFETVMSHPSKVELFAEATAEGYATQLIFVCTDDPEINVRRVAKRVAAGGHDVPEDKIRSRYHSALALLPAAIAACDYVTLLDTTGEAPQLVATLKHGTWKTHAPTPNWAATLLLK